MAFDTALIQYFENLAGSGLANFWFCEFVFCRFAVLRTFAFIVLWFVDLRTCGLADFILQFSENYFGRQKHSGAHVLSYILY